MTGVELVGNALCLDFTNTVNARPVAARDWLATADGVSQWARAVGLPVTGSASEFAAGLPATRELRETVHRALQPLARGGQPPRGDLDALVGQYAEAVAAATVRRTGEVFGLRWPGPRTLRVLRWQVAASAVELLTQGPLDRLGECPACGWLFLDTSKNRRRRWCSMASCGSREKARRYYHRS